MKILHVITTLGYGGAERLLLDTVSEQQENHTFHIVYFKGEPYLKEKFPPDVTIHKVSLGVKTVNELNLIYNKVQPDLIHTHLGHADLFGLWAFRNRPVKKLCTMHNIWFKWDWRDYLFFGLYKFLIKRQVNNVNYISISDAVHEHVKNRLKVSDENAHLLYNAIPENKDSLDQSVAKQELSFSDDNFLILFMGRLRIQKSVDTLIKAVSLIKNELREHNSKVLIVGNGVLKNELRDLSNQLNLEDIISFEGITASPEIYHDAADLFVLPSVFEGFGLVILESFRAKTPVIATNIEGPRELIIDNENGYLFEPKDFKGLSNKILKLLKDSSKLKSLGEKGYNTFRKEFHISNYVTELEKIYKNA